MILFLYGEDNFRSHEKLMAIKKKHIDASLGDTNLSQLDFTDRDYNITDVTRQVLAMPFLAKSRLVILKNLLSSKKTKNIQEQTIKLLPKVPQSTILVFYEAGMPDRRSALFKKLLKEKSQEFKPLESYQIRQWIIKEIAKNNFEIDSQAIELLIEYCGSDLWKIKNELKKLFVFNSQFSAEDVENLVRPKIEAKIFNLMDAFGTKNLQKAHQELYNLLEKGEPELYIFTMIVGQFRNLLIIKDLIGNNAISNKPFVISKASGLHPYVVQKNMVNAKNFTMEELKKFYQKLLDYDTRMKTGELAQKLALDLLVSELCR